MENTCKNTLKLETYKDSKKPFYILKGKKASMILGFHGSKKKSKTHKILGDQNGLP
jgi:hypothetical protein